MSPLALSLRFLQTQSDAHLAALARAGHERAFEALVRRYRRELLAYCRRVGSAQSNAEDTLQQALLQAWSAIRTGVEVREPRAWLYRIVHNVAVSNQRRPVVVPIELRDTPGTHGADHEAEQRMAAREALAGMAALPDLQREVMVGTAVDGMSHEELATALGLSSGAVRGLIYRARATLRAAAAAITPAPVISWALRSGSGTSIGLYEALGGGGSAGLGGLLIKGGAIAATAGAIATATGISTSQKAVHHRPATAAAAGRLQAADSRLAAPARPKTTLVSASTSTRALVTRGTRAAAAAPGHAESAHKSGDHGPSDHSFSTIGGKRHGAGDTHRGDGEGGSNSGTGAHHSGDGGSDRGPGRSGDGPGSGGETDGSHSGSGSGGSPSGSGSTLPDASGGDDHGGQVSGTSGGSGGPGSGESISTDGSTIPTVSSHDGSSGPGDGGTTTTATTTALDDGGTDSGHHRGK